MSENWHTVFNNTELDNELHVNGYTKIRLFHPEDMLGIVNPIKEHDPDFLNKMENRFYSLVEDPSYDIKKAVNDVLQDSVGTVLDKLISSYEPIVFSYVTKGVGEKSILRLHQDWSIVDELHERSFSFWLPLIETNAENGGLYVLPCSHRFDLNIRGGSIHPKFLSRFNDFRKHLRFVPTKPGEALIFDSRIIHYSPPNNTNQIRASVIAPLVRKGIQTYLYNGVSGSIKKYQVPRDFYLRYNEFSEQKDNVPPFTKFVEDMKLNPEITVNDDEIVRLISLSNEAI